MRSYLVLFLFCFSVLAGSAHTAHAVEPDEVLENPVLESRARELSTKLRCLVCQNQSIDDSDAPLAKDLRVLVRERLVAGDSDEAVLDYVVGRYGEFALLQPRFAFHTILLWAAPILLLFGGIFAFLRLGRRKVTIANAPTALSEKEETAIHKLLDDRD